MIKAIIFDMDGVIVNSEPLWKIVNFEIYRKYKIFMDDKIYEKVIGRVEEEVFGPFFEEKGFSGKELEEINKKAIKERRELFMKKAEKRLEMFKGAKEKIIELKNKGYKLAIATSSFKSLMDLVVDKFEIREYFDILYSAEDVKNGKPNPEIYLKTMNKLNVKPNETVIIEDSINGIKAAKASGAYCIAVETTNPKEKLIVADKVIKEINKLDIPF